MIPAFFFFFFLSVLQVNFNKYGGKAEGEEEGRRQPDWAPAFLRGLILQSI